MFSRRVNVAAVEIGTSKINVLVGAVEDDQLTIIGKGSALTNGSVIKGEICDMAGAEKALEQAKEQAAYSSKDALLDCRELVLVVTGCGIECTLNSGIAFIRNPDRIVTETERAEAIDNAKVMELAADREIISVTDSYWMLDHRRCSNPLNQRGSKLVTQALIVHGVTPRLDNFRNTILRCGFENCRIDTVYAPLAASEGVMTEDEIDNGALLVDLGAGCTDYLESCDGGARCAGTLQLGMDHAANDLSIGLHLPFTACRRLFEEGTLAKAQESHVPFLEFPLGTGGSRKIPMTNFDTIADARLREIFQLVKARIGGAERHPLYTGGILTGGGALYPRAAELFSQVFEMPCRIGSVANGGSGIESPRFSAVWGALNLAKSYYQDSPNGGNSTMDRALDGLNHIWVKAIHGFGRAMKTIKF